jgi:hypothetical protein
MRMIKTENALTVRTVNGQRVVQPVRSLGGGLDAPNTEAHAVIALNVDNHDLSVEVE